MSGKINTIRDLIDLRATENGETVFLIAPDSGDSITYAELQQRSVAISAYLKQQNIAPGSSVAYAMSNGADSTICMLGILYAGYRATAINLIAGKQTITYVLEHSETKFVFTQSTHRELVDACLLAAVTETPVSVVNVDSAFLQSINSTSTVLAPLTADHDGILMYTSGTTGVPKGVVLSHANLITGGDNTRLAHELTDNDRALCVLPLYHINGLCVTIMGPLISAGSVVIPERFSTSHFWSWLEQNNCTWFSVVPTQISYLLHADTHPQDVAQSKTDNWHQVRFGRSASAPLSPDIQQAFEARFALPIIETMGLTETSAQILSNPLPPGVRKSGSAGIPCGNEVIIADTQQNELPAGVEGELMVRGNNVMKHYFKNPQATSEALTRSGWFRTGDLGRKDEDGYLFITGRLKELIIKGGENIAPREVDEALYRHPDVIEAAAFACNCLRYGQRIEAAVAVKAHSQVNELELLELCKTHIGDFKKPDKIHFLLELPKGPSGKIQRIRLGEMLNEAE